MTRTPDVAELTNRLLIAYPHKKWVIDAGALQMVDPSLLNGNCIITPHQQEFKIITEKLSQLVKEKYYTKVPSVKTLFVSPNDTIRANFDYERKGLYSGSHLTEEGSKNNFLMGIWENPIESYVTYKNSQDPYAPNGFHDLNWDLYKVALAANNTTILLKGKSDLVICPGNECIVFSGDEVFMKRIVEVSGGNAGMTKGGTGDVLAGLVAALYATNDAMTAAVVASYVNKKAGDELYKTVGPFFNASELVEMVPRVMWDNIEVGGLTL
jgi:NAD(P)H-hydrate repair Nnr-like enzyme with NAD(P)H-hydrate dehydratase domain